MASLAASVAAVGDVHVALAAPAQTVTAPSLPSAPDINPAGAPPVHISTCPPVPGLDQACAVANLGQFFSGVQSFGNNPVGGVGDFVRKQIVGDDPGILIRIFTGRMDPNDPTETLIRKIWHGFFGIAWVVLAIAASWRALAAAHKGQPPVLLLWEVVVRGVVVPGVMFISFDLIVGLAAFSSDFAGTLFAFIVRIGGQPGDANWGVSFVTQMQQLTQGGGTPGPLGVAQLVLLIMLLYVAALSVMGYVLLLFNTAVAAPLIAFSAHDTNNPFFQWWFKTTAGLLIAPFIKGAIGGLTLILTAGGPARGGVLSGGLISCVWAIGGLAVMGKFLHHFTLGAFSGQHISNMARTAEAGLMLPLRPMNVGSSYAKTASAVAGGGGRSAAGSAGSKQRLMVAAAQKNRTVASQRADAMFEGSGEKTKWERAALGAVGHGLWKEQIEAAAVRNHLPAEAWESVKLASFLGEGDNERMAVAATISTFRDRSFIPPDNPSFEWPAIQASHGGPRPTAETPAPTRSSTAVPPPSVAQVEKLDRIRTSTVPASPSPSAKGSGRVMDHMEI
jgi:hypothetical protein